MNGTAVTCALDAALGLVAVIAGRRLVRRSPRRAVQSAAHLAMAGGMVAMTVPGGGPVPGGALRLGYGALAAALAVSSLGRRRRHRLHHAAMFAVMTLMTGTTTASSAMPGMSMPIPVSAPGTAPSPALLAAFGYVCVFALLLGWRIPVMAEGDADSVGHACEIVMLVCTAVMLLPMV
jgi:hypothetical protein